MAKLSGVEIIIIIGVGFAVFVILFIVAHRQIARFKVRDLLSKPLLKQNQFGASPAYTAQLQRKVAEMLDVDVQPQMWDDHWVRFFKSQSAPNYIHRGKALDFSVLLKLELLRFGRQFEWTAFEELGDYFERLKTEYPIERIPSQTITEFLRLYQHCRYGEVDFTEREYERMVKLITDMLELLRHLRTAAPTARSLSLLYQPLEADRVDPKDKSAPKKFPRGYELLESDGSTVGSVLTKKSQIRSLAKLRKAGNRKGRPIQHETSWEEQVPLHVFHDNPLINFEPAASTSRKSRDKLV